jgi:hypothetical protein
MLSEFPYVKKGDGRYGLSPPDPVLARSPDDLPRKHHPREIHEHPNAPHAVALLRPRHERPRRRASDPRDECAPFH